MYTEWDYSVVLCRCRLLVGVGAALPRAGRSEDALALLTDAAHIAHARWGGPAAHTTHDRWGPAAHSVCQATQTYRNIGGLPYMSVLRSCSYLAHTFLLRCVADLYNMMRCEVMWSMVFDRCIIWYLFIMICA